MSREELARRQAALVAALVLGQSVPEGFDPDRVRATTEALLRKRASEVGAQWPALRSQLGPQWSARFAAWAAGRAPQGSLRDGWDFARTLTLAPAAALELAGRKATYRYDDVHPPRPRRWPSVRRAPGALVVQFRGRLHILQDPRHR
jgi:hypothetical protein